MSAKTFLITGCSNGGIGHGPALAFANRGLQVYATARDVKSMESLRATTNITLLPLDVTSVESIATVVAQVDALDYLVNNAGPSSKTRSLFDLNVWKVVAMIQAFAPLNVRSRGTIVNIALITTSMHLPWFSIYSASKNAIDCISGTLRLGMNPFEVQVVTVVTGIVKTNLLESNLRRAAFWVILYCSCQGDLYFLCRRSWHEGGTSG